jgi:hypothetical protein
LEYRLLKIPPCGTKFNLILYYGVIGNYDSLNEFFFLALAFSSYLTAEVSIFEEPSAGKLLTGICAGGTG